MATRDPNDPSDGLAATIAGEAAAGARTPIVAGGDFDQRFLLRGELARGGMGRVVLATDTVLRREVAIKELLEASNPGLAQRFEREALLTARLQHPGVVGVYEFARHGEGVAALVMRRVRGQPFDVAIRAATSLAQRVALLAPFISACDAVAYAHREGVIHRDLKPANVLLGDFGDTVVIDWGLAKDLRDVEPDFGSTPEMASASREAMTSGPSLTVAGAVMGTPQYMAPEQARGEPADTRSDVYALGAMLYQLLVGDAPYEGNESRQVVEAVLRGPPRALIEREPQLQPELVTIVERAMARDPHDRYANAGELSAELKRFQAGQLVSSHRYSTRELLFRWARKHVAVLTAIFVALVVLGVFAVLEHRRILAERDRANAEAVSAGWSLDFMVQMFDANDPKQARGNTVTARSVLDRAAERIAQTQSVNPVLSARLMMAMGKAYRNLGLRKPALALFQHALQIREEQLGPDDKHTLESRNAVGGTLAALSQLPEAEAMMRETITLAQHRWQPDEELTIKAMQDLANVLYLEGRFAEAQKIAEGELALAQGRYGPHSKQMTGALTELANALSRQEKVDEAIALRKEVVEIEASLGESEYLALLRAKVNLAADYYHKKDYAASEKLQLEVTSQFEKVLGAKHPDTMAVRGNLANLYSAQGKYAEAEALHRTLLDQRREVDGPKSPTTLGEIYNLGCVLAREGRTEQALAYLTEAVDGGLSVGIDLAKDDDLVSLHGNPAFEALVARRKAAKH